MKRYRSEEHRREARLKLQTALKKNARRWGGRDLDYLKLREKVKESYFSCLQENVVKWTLFDNTAQTRGEMHASTFIAFASVLQETVSKGSVAFISRLFMVSNSLMELPFFPLFFLENTLSFGTVRCLMCTHSAKIGCYSCYCYWRITLIFSPTGQGPYQYSTQSTKE